MKKILIATDSFKDALPALDVCKAIQKGIVLADATLGTSLFPLADGGEGTAAVLNFHNGGKMRSVEVYNPLLKKIKAQYNISIDGRTAYIEMAQASGLQLLELAERNCYHTTSYGTGELILDAIKNGVKKIILGLGGSATNDAGMGMAIALGYRFFDKEGNELKGVGENLIAVDRIDDTHLKFDKSKVRIEVIVDVDNLLYGTQGAAHVYGKQKGANEDEIASLDMGLRYFSELIRQHFKTDVSAIKGGGAAGGMGAGAIVFLNAKISSGIDLIMTHTHFEKELQSASLIITGEGKIDAQTLHGKLINGVARSANKYGIPVIALCGSLDAEPEDINALGLLAAYSIINAPTTLDNAISQTADNLSFLAYNIIRTLSKSF